MPADKRLRRLRARLTDPGLPLNTLRVIYQGLSQRHLWVWLLSYVVNLNKIQVFKQTGLTETLPAQTKLDRNDSNGKRPLDTQTTASRNQAGKTTQLPTLMEEPEHSHRRPES